MRWEAHSIELIALVYNGAKSHEMFYTQINYDFSPENSSG